MADRLSVTTASFTFMLASWPECDKRSLTHFGEDAINSAIAHYHICGPSIHDGLEVGVMKRILDVIAEAGSFAPSEARAQPVA
jgi:hypothetical protein